MLAGIAVISSEISRIQIEMGYAGEGCWQAYRGEERPPWRAVCLSDFGFTETTVRNYSRVAEAVRKRLAGREDAQQILVWMDQKPSDLSAAERAALIEGIRTLALREGDTLSGLSEELKVPAVLVLPAPTLREVAPTQCEVAPALDAEDINEVELFAVAAGVNPTTARMVGILHALKLRKKKDDAKKRIEEANLQRKPLSMESLARLALRAFERERAERLGIPIVIVEAEKTGGSES